MGACISYLSNSVQSAAGLISILCNQLERKKFLGPEKLFVCLLKCYSFYLCSVALASFHQTVIAHTSFVQRCQGTNPIPLCNFSI